MKPTKVLSGGQRGADQAGLRAAVACAIPTGGSAPYRYMTETGPAPWLRTRYGLVELGDVQGHGSPAYGPRTVKNVEDADVTFIFGDLRSTGSRLTIRVADARKKPIIENPSAAYVRHVVEQLAEQLGRGVVVNIAGNRESKNAGIGEYVEWVLKLAWGFTGTVMAEPWPHRYPKLSQPKEGGR